MYFTADRYEIRYSTSRRILENDFSAAKEVTQNMIRGDDFKLAKPKHSGVKENVTINYPSIEGNQVSYLNCLLANLSSQC